MRGRKSAGSRTGAAKSRDRWRVCVRGRRAKVRRPSRQLVDGRRPGPFGTVTFDEGTGKAVSVMRAGPIRPTRVATGASEVDTLDSSAEDNAAEREMLPVGPALRSGARQDRVASAPAGSARRVKRDRTQLEVRRQTHRDPGGLLGLTLHRTWMPRESAVATSGIGRSVEVHMSRVGCRSR
jgi:hypothetical protein